MKNEMIRNFVWLALWNGNAIPSITREMEWSFHHLMVYPSTHLSFIFFINLNIAFILINNKTISLILILLL